MLAIQYDPVLGSTSVPARNSVIASIGLCPTARGTEISGDLPLPGAGSAVLLMLPQRGATFFNTVAHDTGIQRID